MKIKAYTLMEVTVAMLISGICITICYTAYSLIGNYYIAFQQRNDAIDRVLTLKHVLEQDFLKSKLILRSEEGMALLNDTAEITYSMSQSGVVRMLNLVHADTFKVEISGFQSYFESEEIVKNDTIDQVDLTFHISSSSPVSMRLHKQYSAKDLFR